LPREPCQKGTSVLPIIAALKANPDREKLVPQHLWKYFEDHLLVSGWYPEKDYFALLEALVKTIDPRAVGGDVWRYFARFSVKRDIGGTDAGGVRTPAETKGVYRNFATGTGDPEQLLKRGVRLWSQYHDSGTMRISGGRVRTNSVFMQLVGFHIPVEGFVRLQGYYLEEFGRLVGVDVESAVTKSTTRGSRYCEWEHTLGRTPASEAYVASLAPIP
jgi:hypothetical protein